jgi:hypothetical protein
VEIRDGTAMTAQAQWRKWEDRTGWERQAPAENPVHRDAF